MKEIIENLFKDFIYTYKESSNSQTKWEEPIIGFAEATDPGFTQLKNIIDGVYITGNQKEPYDQIG